MSRNSKIILISISLLFLCGLCGGTIYAYKAFIEPRTREIEKTETPIVNESTDSADLSSTGETETSDSVDKLPYHAVVQITAQFYDNGELINGWTGSGTIISPDGLILTNAHVVLPDNNLPVDALLISITGNPDEFPTPSYFAEVLQADIELDLAVIKITTDLIGNPIDQENLNLPAVPLGDSDALNLGEKISILGYPGIGGETITLTSGEVSGFTGEASYGNRAFIKTNATIAGGNSGGLAVNDSGEIIGVPTQLGYGGDQEVVDCRILADTNGDGRINENDTCIPTGGFINSLRPVNLALPLIESAKRGEVNIPSETFSDYPTPAGSEGIVYSDDFSDPESGWDVFNDSEGDVSYQNGKYSISVNTAHTVYWGVSGNVFSDVNLESMATVFNTSGDGDFGFICRYVDRGNFYAIELSEDGYAVIWMNKNGEQINLVEWNYIGEVTGSAHHIGASCVGNKISLLLEGQEVASTIDSTFQMGDIGFIAGTNEGANFVVLFDNMVVKEP